MAEQEIERSDTENEGEERTGARTDLPRMDPHQALERLRQGKPIKDVRIEEMVFRGEFEQPVRLNNCVLVKPRFNNATFKAEVSFIHCTLERPQFAKENLFEGDWILRSCTLHSTTITKVTVKGTLNAEFAHIKGNFFLLNSRFEGTVRFWETSFHNWVNIKSCTFAGEADFRSFHAHKGVTISRSRFEKAALFRGTVVSMKCDLADSHFEGILDLSRSKLHDYVYLEGIGQGEKQRFAFANAVGERFLIRPEQLIGRLESEEAGNHHQAMHEYALLKRVFSGLHRYEQEDWAFYRFKVNQRRCKERTWWKPWTRATQFADWLLLDLGCGYGANPMRAVRAALIIMLGFGLIYMFGIEEFYVEKLPFDGDKTTWPNRIMIGTLTSVSVFTSGIGGIRDMARGWMNIPLVVESMLGTLLWGLFIVAFSRKVIR